MGQTCFAFCTSAQPKIRVSPLVQAYALLPPLLPRRPVVSLLPPPSPRRVVPMPYRIHSNCSHQDYESTTTGVHGPRRASASDRAAIQDPLAARVALYGLHAGGARTIGFGHRHSPMCVGYLISPSESPSPSLPSPPSPRGRAPSPSIRCARHPPRVPRSTSSRRENEKKKPRRSPMVRV